jgi:hypothetical protein
LTEFTSHSFSLRPRSNDDAAFEADPAQAETKNVTPPDLLKSGKTAPPAGLDTGPIPAFPSIDPGNRSLYRSSAPPRLEIDGSSPFDGGLALGPLVDANDNITFLASEDSGALSPSIVFYRFDRDLVKLSEFEITAPPICPLCVPSDPPWDWVAEQMYALSDGSVVIPYGLKSASTGDTFKYRVIRLLGETVIFDKEVFDTLDNSRFFSVFFKTATGMSPQGNLFILSTLPSTPPNFEYAFYEVDAITGEVFERTLPEDFNPELGGLRFSNTVFDDAGNLYFAWGKFIGGEPGLRIVSRDRSGAERYSLTRPGAGILDRPEHIGVARDGTLFVKTRISPNLDVLTTVSPDGAQTNELDVSPFDFGDLDRFVIDNEGRCILNGQIIDPEGLAPVGEMFLKPTQAQENGTYFHGGAHILDTQGASLGRSPFQFNAPVFPSSQGLFRITDDFVAGTKVLEHHEPTDRLLVEDVSAGLVTLAPCPSIELCEGNRQPIEIQPIDRSLGIVEPPNTEADIYVDWRVEGVAGFPPDGSVQCCDAQGCTGFTSFCGDPAVTSGVPFFYPADFSGKAVVVPLYVSPGGMLQPGAESLWTTARSFIVAGTPTGIRVDPVITRLSPGETAEVRAVGDEGPVEVTWRASRGESLLEVPITGTVSSSIMIVPRPDAPTGSVSLTIEDGAGGLANGYVAIRRTGALVVNTQRDGGDLDPGDGVCDTGNLTGDGAPECTLRAAIEETNANPDKDLITFAIGGEPGDVGALTIRPNSPLPPITRSVTIDATTEPGYVEGVPKIVLNGLFATGAAAGLEVRAGNSTIRGLTMIEWPQNGIILSGTGGNTIEGNLIGLNDLGGGPGNQSNGVLIDDSPENVIGGETPDKRNVISGNQQNGIRIVGVNSINNQVLGNFIGSDLSGTSRIRNGLNGVLIENTQLNQIGDLTSVPGEPPGNVISGNEDYEIKIIGFSALLNRVQGNLIGPYLVNEATTPHPNGGVLIEDGRVNTIGGMEVAARNIISRHSIHGIVIRGADAFENRVQGNFIGTDLTGVMALRNESGVLIENAVGTIVGGLTDKPGTPPGNVISGNRLGSGLTIAGMSAKENLVLGNLFGTDKDGLRPVPNGSITIIIFESGDNLIGGENEEARNIISSASAGAGVEIFIHGMGATGNKVQGNFIGTDITGTKALGFGLAGVRIKGVTRTIIGGIASSPGTPPGNLISGGRDFGIWAEEAHQNLIQGNLIGTDLTGKEALGNKSAGIFLYLSDGNRIGGAEEGARNIASGNGSDTFIGMDAGIRLFGNFNVVEGNYIGTDITGMKAIPNNLTGLMVAGSNNRIGGTESGAGNVVSGNKKEGIRVTTDVAVDEEGGEGGATEISAIDTRIQGNLIGVDASGLERLGNGVSGIQTERKSDGTVIGGTDPAAANVISSSLDGIRLAGGIQTEVIGNFIGTDRASAIDLGCLRHGILVESDNEIIRGGNTISFNRGAGIHVLDSLLEPSRHVLIRENSIFDNQGLGIDLFPMGVTINDPMDADTGNNDLQNYPLLTSAEIDGANIIIQGRLESRPSLLYRIEFFSNFECDPSGFGEGETFLGATQVVTSATGFATFSVSLPMKDPSEVFITATAINFDTSIFNEEALNTSEFSQCLRIGADPEPTPTPMREPTPTPFPEGFEEFPDFNGDGIIGHSDLLKLLEEKVDLTGDGIFNDLDSFKFQRVYFDQDF